ncbi:SIR2 family protein [Streptomyces sp. NBC_00287]|uniref:SIR2 family protein n=1 Tax=Streptomyces sp. NBC_00287 TaxID=2975702 RepID=UPI002E2914FD|nr:SIR2 family protein [Streptomyces sp. NBC_00287]
MTDHHDRPPAAAAVRGLDPLISLAMCVHAGPGVYALLLGAGMSRDAGVPTGWEIVTDLVRRAAVAKGADQDLAAADPEAWWARHGDGGPLGYSGLLEALGDTPAARHKLLRGYFEPGEEGLRRPGVAHHAVARLMARGSVRVVLTTNFDRLTEQALAAAGVQPQVIHSPDSLRGMTPLAHARATVVKLHGDLTDLEARNTEHELSAYPAAWAGLVDQVLDEYGLIVCGWSAQWDHALSACFERRATRRYPFFWAAPHGPHGKAAELVARHGAVVVRGVTAKEFFPGLLDRVEALDRLTEPAPTRELSVARLKRALPDPVRRIELHELVDAEATRVVERLSDSDRYPLDEHPSDPRTYRDLLLRYQSDCDTLLHLLAVGAFHDEGGVHTAVWVRAVQRLLSAPGSLYPALLALSAAGSAAVLAGRDELFGRLLLEPSLAGPSEPRPAVLALRTEDVLGDGDFLNALLAEPYPPSLVLTSHSTWLRERLRDVLAEPGADSDRAISDAFDAYEYLTALVQADLSETPVALGEFTLPDRWDGDRRLRVAERVQARFSETWPLLRSGAFGGRIQRAHTAAAVVDVLCAERHREAMGAAPLR